MTSTPSIDDLLAIPVTVLLHEPTTAAELADRLDGQGIGLSAARAGDLLARAGALGFARVTGYVDGEARYVATSLGTRAATALTIADPEMAVGLDELERLRSDVLATVGHELRTPLTAIRTSVGLLLDPGLEPNEGQRQQLLGAIGRSADRMSHLLTELLDLARLRAGRIEMTSDRFDACELARDVAVAVGPMASARNQRIELDLPDGAVPMVGDRRRLEQALLNLAANAQKFSPTGAEVTVSVRLEAGQVRWTVTDHGPGIGAAERARLFERFFVGSSEPGVSSGSGGGAGIGLPTALAIAQAHGGTIEVDSEVGRGSAFHLVVPDGQPS